MQQPLWRDEAEASNRLRHWPPDAQGQMPGAHGAEPLSEDWQALWRAFARSDAGRAVNDFLAQRLAHMDLHLDVSPAALAELAKVGFDPVYGARPLKRAIQQRIENPLSKLLLEGKFLPQQVVAISVDPVRFPGEFKFTPQDAPKEAKSGH